jgi:hypothetical protein
MGRKGMKGFMKSATRPSDKPVEDEAPEEQAAAPAPAAGSKASSSSSSSQQKAAELESKSASAAAAGSGSEDEGQDGKETRGKMLQRHKRVRQRVQPYQHNSINGCTLMHYSWCIHWLVTFIAVSEVTRLIVMSAACFHAVCNTLLPCTWRTEQCRLLCGAAYAHCCRPANASFILMNHVYADKASHCPCRRC